MSVNGEISVAVRFETESSPPPCSRRLRLIRQTAVATRDRTRMVTATTMPASSPAWTLFS
ncbi:hypothetical protein K438DRAFT_1822141 [Mycena galopus ATCC 62051]|nr:hypothetical protein K438DRAFT_1822141 [Mycena galopus ATCC 62051]